MNKNSTLKGIGVALAVVSVMVLESAYAATFRVNSTVDQPGVCTFEAALAETNWDIHDKSSLIMAVF